ncbi:hypothetical protein [Paenibacillus sp. J31TS4]|uniref:hypothetical protein n=1 Tax=Paenibacillus sp. J31TS4 TaxID=2807195 RepID=UPI001BD0A447|nr:hypothetical protein [Paenibacillus sp. J31TS4]
MRKPGRLPHDAPPAAGVLRLLLIGPDAAKIEACRQLLAGCGLRIHPLRYWLWKRLTLGAALLAVAIGYAALSRPYLALYLSPYAFMATGGGAGLLLLADRTVLEAIRRQRTGRIVKEIYTISRQLLYYNGSRLNLHAKLERCLPFSRGIRKDFAQLLNEWYYDPAAAIGAFRLRLGTDEAYSFAETLDSIRRHEHESYYDLLRQRIGDYKDRIELAKESRKETASYLLFLLAGIPILNTFRLFIYPWVQEGQKLFQTLN